MRFNFIRVWAGFSSKMGSDLFYPQETGQIADRLYAIRDKDINLFLYSDGESTLCIDAGYINNDYSVLCTAHTKCSRDFERAMRQWRR